MSRARSPEYVAWDRRRRSINHDWLCNMLLVRLDKWCMIEQGAVMDHRFSAEEGATCLLQWPNARGRIASVVSEARVLFPSSVMSRRLRQAIDDVRVRYDILQRIRGWERSGVLRAGVLRAVLRCARALDVAISAIRYRDPQGEPLCVRLAEARACASRLSQALHDLGDLAP